MSVPQFTVTQLEEQFLDMYKDTTEETRAEEFYQKCMKLFNDAYKRGHRTGYEMGADKWFNIYLKDMEEDIKRREKKLGV